jgi:hypothetical protein
MSKPILVVVVVILAIAGVFLFVSFAGARKSCKTYSEAECRTKLICKPFYEYGLSCGEGGCKEGQRFKECQARF